MVFLYFDRPEHQVDRVVDFVLVAGHKAKLAFPVRIVADMGLNLNFDEIESADFHLYCAGIVAKMEYVRKNPWENMAILGLSSGNVVSFAVVGISD